MKYCVSCNCGNVEVSVNFPHPIEKYQARECNCDFCRANGLAYLSDPNGTLSLTAKDPMKQLKQGSLQATFWQCARCMDIVAVTHSNHKETKGAVCKKLFEAKYLVQPSVCVSPKDLTPTEKLNHWNAAWSTVIDT
ncbi:aldehyde-activating protein [Pseudoalteromonas sp. Of7M-16]|uniref:aldehyde-activating protein n=1 Tax=Pseudoalteromonas sp. Of7M-16 TaxID=2917756 RepID=UPI001EF5BE56|nr:aldehyde-activating protein [Pseudoalteromonas sp. Of7M-16]MCG7549980.1 aldehyde-activating protein [Pseudoalteromonas sp. Of7M-16]